MDLTLKDTELLKKVSKRLHDSCFSYKERLGERLEASVIMGPFASLLMN